MTQPQKEGYRSNLEKLREDWLKKFTVFQPGELVLALNPMASFSESTVRDVPVATWFDISDPYWVPVLERERMMDTQIPGCYPVLYLEPHLEIGLSPEMHLMAKILVDERIYICREDHLVKMPEHFLKTFGGGQASSK